MAKETQTAVAAPNVYQCIAAVSAEIAKAGISKDRNNQQQGYKFRGIDDVYNALAPILAAHGLIVIPRIVDRQCVERVTKNGGVLFYVTVKAEFVFVSAADGSMVSAETYGEAMDSGDKATNKAMSAAYKYAAFQTFCIPTEGDNDADRTTHDVAAKVPEGFGNWLMDLEATADEGMDKLKAMWKQSNQALRDFLMHTDNAKWEGIKAKADKKDAEKKQPAGAAA